MIWEVTDKITQFMYIKKITTLTILFKKTKRKKEKKKKGKKRKERSVTFTSGIGGKAL